MARTYRELLFISPFLVYRRFVDILPVPGALNLVLANFDLLFVLVEPLLVQAFCLFFVFVPKMCKGG